MIFLGVVVLKHICKFFDTIPSKRWSWNPLPLIIMGWLEWLASSEWNWMEMMLHDFWGWIIKGDRVATWCSRWGCASLKPWGTMSETGLPWSHHVGETTWREREIERWRGRSKKSQLFQLPAVSVFPEHGPDMWVNKLQSPQLMPSRTDTSCPHPKALPKLQIHAQNKYSGCFKPLTFGVVCYIAIMTGTLGGSPCVQWSVFSLLTVRNRGLDDDNTALTVIHITIANISCALTKSTQHCAKDLNGYKSR